MAGGRVCWLGGMDKQRYGRLYHEARYDTTPYSYPATPYFSDVPSTDIFPSVQKMAQMGITAG